jgi:hypothetical protein
MPIKCQQCPYVIEVPPGERRPPWCPRCGADLKETAEAAKPRDDAPQSTPPAPTPPQGDHERPRPRPPVARRESRTDEDAAPEVFTSKFRWQALAWLMVVICSGIVAIAAMQAINPPAGKPLQMGVYGVMGLFAVGTLVSLYVALGLAGQKYEVYPDRLVAYQFFNPTTIRWDKIREVFRDEHSLWTRFRIVTRLGMEVTIRGETTDHKRLGELISEQVAELLLPDALAELEAGRSIRLGPLTVSSGGVTIDGEMQPWHRIGILTYGLNPRPKRGTSQLSNMIHVRIGDCWVEVGEIPNLQLFQGLAHQLFLACAV